MFKLAFHSLINRKNVILLVFFSLTISVMLFIGVQRTKEVARNSFSRTISGTDLIIGARTGQINLILYSVFNIGRAVNNMGYDSYLELTDREEVAWTVPLSMGDSYRGFRVVGTDESYFSHYTYGNKKKLVFADGNVFKDPFGIVLGASVAKEFSHRLRDSMILSHGSGINSIHKHDNLPFSVVGILKETGTPVDKSVFVPLEGITAIHIGWETGVKSREVSKEQVLAADLEPKAITSALVGLKKRSQVFQFQRIVNDYEKEPLMAILPGAALYELWSIVGVADQALSFISGAVVFIGLLSLLSAQLAVVNLRRREMALYRSLGATPFQLFLLLFAESFILTAAGCLAGLALLYLFQYLISLFFSTSGFFLDPELPSKQELIYLIIILFSGSMVGIIPAISVYKKSLTDGLSVRA